MYSQSQHKIDLELGQGHVMLYVMSSPHGTFILIEPEERHEHELHLKDLFLAFADAHHASA